MERFGEELFPDHPDEQFPLLVKFIDARSNISIQVHPDAEICRQLYPSERAKAETWVIIHVEPGAAVLHGLKPNVPLEELRRRCEDGTVIEAMRRVEVRPGDVLHLPAGTLHAMLEGVTLLEIQEPSDSTFRVYDHDRMDSDGRPRELHLEQALRSLRPGEAGPPLIEPRRTPHAWGSHEILVQIDQYSVERLYLERERAWRPPGRVPAVMVVIAGQLEVRWDDGEGRFVRGETFIVPPGIEALRLVPVEPACVVVATPGER